MNENRPDSPIDAGAHGLHGDRLHGDRVHTNRLHGEHIHADRVHTDRFHTDRFHGDPIRARTRFEAAAVGLRLVLSIAHRFELIACLDDDGLDAPTGQQALLAALRCMLEQAAALGIQRSNQSFWQQDIASLRAAGDMHPLSRLAKVAPDPRVGELVTDLVLLAGLPELHEACATLFRLLHPDDQPYPTVTLALHWLEFEAGINARPALRDAVEDLLLHSPLARLGLVRLAGDGPWHGRLLRPGPGVWEALNGRQAQLDGATFLPGFKSVPGLAQWMQQNEVQQAVAALTRGEPCLIAVLGGNETMRATRVRALLGASGMAAMRVCLNQSQALPIRSSAAIDSYCAAFMQQACPWLEITADESNSDSQRLHTPGLQWQLPVLVSTSAEHALPELGLPILALRIEGLGAAARRDMWSALLPGLAEHAGLLAARYPIDPDEARNIAADLALRQRVENRALTFDDIGSCLRSRTLWRSRPGVQRVIPRADWKSLLLPDSSLGQLQQAVLRVHQQITVLDDWGFEQGRHDRRGLRMLFYGPPGTGKTLAAEAMARALGIDMLVVDIASLVSKWIGETEKNLAGVFELAEASRALLLFDEADALFGRRTDANDANDRHANLETAFLLQRLERYEGVAVLTTNLRSSLDAAFTRRFEYIIEFPEPDASTRLRLWQLHLPATAPLGRDVDLEELAEWYALSGAQIRNASLGAAFLAATDSGEIAQLHFLRAIEREYDKAGKAHPGYPAARNRPAEQKNEPRQNGAAFTPPAQGWPETAAYGASRFDQ